MGESGGRALTALSSAVFLPERGALRRLPRAAHRKRPDAFWAAFEDRALVYDCFWSADRRDVILACPPPNSLAPQWQKARFTAMPSGEALTPRFFISRSTMTVTLEHVPQDTAALALDFGGETFNVPIQPNLGEELSGRRVMFTMNKDNDLKWISLWADWHARLHGVDAVIVFDNGSTHYGTKDVEQTLLGVSGIKKAVVLTWPYRYGPVDLGVLFHPYWANFLQVASFRVVVSRLAPNAAGILNCDIDELVGIDAQGGVFDALDNSANGFVSLKGTWIETQSAPDMVHLPFHLRYRYRRKNPLKAMCANKWSLDPKRHWVSDFDNTPMMHRIYGLPRAIVKTAPQLPFFHFRAINTNWKEERTKPGFQGAHATVRVTGLDAQIELYLAKTSPS